MAAGLQELAESYALLREREGCVCRESDAPALDELRLQALWQNAALRPSGLALHDGVPVEVLEPGRWNRSAGPDFQDALVVVGGMLRRGDIEMHVRPSDWDAHGHAGDPAYAGLVLHVTWFESPAAGTLPPGLPTVALRPFAERQGPFDFASVDLSSVPYPQSAEGHPCRERLSSRPGEVERLLASAGYFRLLAKARLFAEGLRAQEPFQSFYEGLMAAMGYRRNVEPFRRLAHETPFARIEAFPSLQRFAALAGVAGLLDETRRELWDLWWRSGLQPPLVPYAWDFRALRPQNHPLRRLAGAVGVLHAAARLLELPLDRLSTALTEAADLLRGTLGAKSALIGTNRANAVVTNLFVPYRLALGTLHPERLIALPGEDISMPMRDTWHRLTGTLYGIPKDGLHQQGLLQVYADFCHNARLVCGTCPVARF